MEAVIYKIVNLVNDKFYVGSTSNKKERFKTHRQKLRAGTHHCHHLQAAWNKYGEAKFSFEIIERLDSPTHLEDAEDSWLVAHVGKPYCYNHGTRARAPRRGVRHLPDSVAAIKAFAMAPEQRAIRSAATKQQWYENDPRTGQKHSEEAKAKISQKVQAALAEGRSGKFIPTVETRAKMSASLMGNKCAVGVIRTPEQRAAISERMRGTQLWKGKTHTAESKARMSKAVHAMPDNIAFPSLTAALTHYGMKMPTLRRALKSGKPISKGPLAGNSFKYV